MLILPITTPLIRAGDDIATIIAESIRLQPDDIVVISSKAVATAERTAIDLMTMDISPEARRYAKICHQDPRFTQAVLDETGRMHGEVIGTSPWVLLTSLRPTGLKRGRILCPNAGLDRSNVTDGFAIGWPEDPVASVVRLRKQLEHATRKQKRRTNQKKIGNALAERSSVSSGSSQSSGSASLAVLLSDSCCMPGRLGVSAFALVCAGMDPIRSEIGKKDLFGSSLQFTNEAIADQLATSANTVMGNAGQCTPAAIFRDHGISLSEYCGWVEGMKAEEDLFEALFTVKRQRMGE